MIYNEGVDILQALVKRFAIPKGKPLTIKAKPFADYDPGFQFERMGDRNTFIGVGLENLPRTAHGLFDGCVAYICDIHTQTHNVEMLSKWHVDYCGALEMMERKERIFKYTAHVGGAPSFQFFKENDEHHFFYRNPRACAKCMKILARHRPGKYDEDVYSVKQYIADFGTGEKLTKRRSVTGIVDMTTNTFPLPDSKEHKEEIAIDKANQKFKDGGLFRAISALRGDNEGD